MKSEEVKRASAALLLQIEALAARSYAEGERELGFVIACVAGAFQMERIAELNEVFCDLLSQQRRVLILKTLAREAAKANASLN